MMHLVHHGEPKLAILDNFFQQVRITIVACFVEELQRALSLVQDYVIFIGRLRSTCRHAAYCCFAHVEGGGYSTMLSFF